MASTPHRATYLLSLWRERTDEPWRAALRPADGGPRVGFGDLEQLAAFLLRLQEELAPEASNHQERGKEGAIGSTPTRSTGNRLIRPSPGVNRTTDRTPESGGTTHE